MRQGDVMSCRGLRGRVMLCQVDDSGVGLCYVM